MPTNDDKLREYNNLETGEERATYLESLEEEVSAYIYSRVETTDDVDEYLGRTSHNRLLESRDNYQQANPPEAPTPTPAPTPAPTPITTPPAAEEEEESEPLNLSTDLGNTFQRKEDGWYINGEKSEGVIKWNKDYGIDPKVFKSELTNGDEFFVYNEKTESGGAVVENLNDLQESGANIQEVINTNSKALTDARVSNETNTPEYVAGQPVAISDVAETIPEGPQRDAFIEDAKKHSADGYSMGDTGLRNVTPEGLDAKDVTWNVEKNVWEKDGKFFSEQYDTKRVEPVLGSDEYKAQEGRKASIERRRQRNELTNNNGLYPKNYNYKSHAKVKLKPFRKKRADEDVSLYEWEKTRDIVSQNVDYKTTYDIPLTEREKSLNTTPSSWSKLFDTDDQYHKGMPETYWNNRDYDNLEEKAKKNPNYKYSKNVYMDLGYDPIPTVITNEEARGELDLWYAAEIQPTKDFEYKAIVESKKRNAENTLMLDDALEMNDIDSKEGDGFKGIDPDLVIGDYDEDDLTLDLTIDDEDIEDDPYSENEKKLAEEKRLAEEQAAADKRKVKKFAGRDDETLYDDYIATLKTKRLAASLLPLGAIVANTINHFQNKHAEAMPGVSAAANKEIRMVAPDVTSDVLKEMGRRDQKILRTIREGGDNHAIGAVLASSNSMINKIQAEQTKANLQVANQNAELNFKASADFAARKDQASIYNDKMMRIWSEKKRIGGDEYITSLATLGKDVAEIHMNYVDKKDAALIAKDTALQKRLSMDEAKEADVAAASYDAANQAVDNQ